MVLPFFPQGTGWTNRGQCLFLWTSPNFNQKAIAAFEAGLRFSLPRCQFFHLARALGSLLLNPPLWMSFSRRSRDQPYPNPTWALVVRAVRKTDVWGCELRQLPLPRESWQWSTYNSRETTSLCFWMLSVIPRAALPVGSYMGRRLSGWAFFSFG